MTEAQIREKLTQLGNPVGAEFSQRKGTSLPTLKPVDGGMCKGLTLDWIRRVLTGGKGTSAGNPFVLDDSNAAKGIASTNAAKNLNQYKKGAYFQLTTNKDSMDEFNRALRKLQSDRFQTKQTEANELLTELNPNALGQEAYDAKVQAIKAEFDTWQTNFHAPSVTADNRLRMFWQYYCKKSTVGKHKSHHLSNLTVVASSANKPYVGGLMEFLPIAIKAVGENQAASVGISPPILNESGHAIGIHCLNTGRYHLFEPNFGVYDMTQASVFKALLFLFAKAYPDSTGIEGDGHRYEIDGVVEGDYVIFART